MICLNHIARQHGDIEEKVKQREHYVKYSTLWDLTGVNQIKKLSIYFTSHPTVLFWTRRNLISEIQISL